MSQTLLVKEICEMFGEYRTPTGFSQKKEVIDKAVDHVFSFDYPIYDEAYRPVLNKKILNHFYMSDIGQESIGLWQHYLETTLNNIMPYYNKLYESELLKFNPLLDIDLEKTYTRGIDGTKTGNSTLDSITDYIRNLQSKIDGQTTSNTSEKTDNDYTSNTTSETDGTVDTVSDSTVSATTKTDGTVDTVSDSTVSATTKADSTTNTDRDEWNLFLDTPQGGLGNFYGMENANGTTGKYLTDARHQYGNQTDVTNSTGENDTISNLTNKDISNTVGESNTVSNQTNKDTTQSTVTDNTIGTNDTIATATGTGTNKVDNVETGTTKTTTGNTSVSEENTNQNEQYTESVVGKQGGASYSKMLLEFRDTILNIDRMILKDLEPLFYGLW